MSQTKETLIGATLPGGYTIKEALGEGGMGAVWLAEDPKLRRHVVIKFPHASMMVHEEFARRFQNEIRAMAALSDGHPNIVSIFDVGEYDGRPFAVMPFLKGGSLDKEKRFQKALRKNGFSVRSGGKPVKYTRQLLRKNLKWLDEIADALDYSHSQNIVHRDVKPPNILFSNSCSACLADYGIAKVIADNSPSGMERTLTGQNVIGTLGYMSHEMLRGKEIDGRADQFALAVTVYEVLGGQRPYNATNQFDIFKQMEAQSFKPLTELSPLVSDLSARILAKALQNDPMRRFASCDEFAQEFRDSLAQQRPNPTPIQPAPVRQQSVTDTTAIQEPAAETKKRPEIVVPRPNPKEKRAAPEPPQIPAGKTTARVADRPRPTSERKADVARKGPAQPLVPKPSRPATAPAQRPVKGQSRRIVCPWCWYEFAPEETLWMATAAMSGSDSQIPAESPRFLPERFTKDCMAIDPAGGVCDSMACPRCHLLTPQSHVDYESKIISMLGVPSSGKSCFLASMARMLRQKLPSSFQFSFMDADPSLNQLLIRDEQVYFNNATTELVKLEKTVVTGGDRYRRVEYGNQSVEYLQPYIFSLSPTPKHRNYAHRDRISYSLCLYDNAGEHFLPGKDSAEAPATRHLAKSDAILFVFDPSQDNRFRARVAKTTRDPQFETGFYPAAMPQDQILVEARSRLRRLGALPPDGRYEKPLVVLVNKFDAWAPGVKMRRQGSPWVQPSNAPTYLKVAHIQKVSAWLRNLLAKLCPEVVGAAEALGANVTYMPVSAFGRRVERDPQTDSHHGVPANQLRPMWAETPLLWIMSQICRGVIPKGVVPDSR